jgi:hypothetical protein
MVQNFKFCGKIRPLHKNNAVNLGGKELSVLQRSLKIIVVLCTLFSFRAKSQNNHKTDSTRSSVFEMRNTYYWIATNENAHGKFQNLSTGIVLAQKIFLILILQI